MLGLDEVMRRLGSALAPRGFDLMQPFRIESYNALVEPPLALEDWGSGDHLAVVVGNTRALWPVWLDALASEPALAAASDPLDAYTERVLGDVVARLGAPASVRFAHETGPRTLPIQRIAHAAGLAFLTETHMSVHPTYGPWIALRAVLSVAVAGPQGAPAPMAHPCGGCGHGCRPAFERALATLAGAPSEANARAHWRAWLDCRDACPVGREHRYSDAQIHYHYRRQLVLPKRA
jgi:cyanocobalamin reductase (cyanide-eliminating) / alkylcobalamin dealkylase